MLPYDIEGQIHLKRFLFWKINDTFINIYNIEKHSNIIDSYSTYTLNYMDCQSTPFLIITTHIYYMDYNILKQIIIDQEDFQNKKPLGFLRNKIQNIKPLLKNPSIIVITGHRRVGKSTLLLQIAKEFYKDNYYYLDFSEPMFKKLEIEDYNTILEIFYKEVGEKTTFFFDEIQGKPEWNLFVNKLKERGNKCFITGSNADLLSKEISTYLTGRHIDIEIYPFSYKEIIEYKNISITPKTTQKNAILLNNFDNYLEQGGFPEVIIFNQKEILKEIYKDIIQKDVILRWDIKNISELEDLAFYLLSHTTNLFNYNSLKKHTQIKDAKTIKQYINNLCKTYMFFELSQFEYSLNKQKKRDKKIYCIDNGFITNVGYGFSIGKPRYLENLVFIELKRKNKEIYFYKDENHLETDFLIVENRKVKEAYQVCYSFEKIETEEREINGLLSALTKYKLKEGKIITYNTEKTIEKDNKIIKIIPAYKWLLE